MVKQINCQQLGQGRDRLARRRNTAAAKSRHKQARSLRLGIS